jgi:hypothetical protein
MVGYDLSVPLKPAWLEALLSEKFFVPCTKHAALKKNERNVFCVDCNGGVCQHCCVSSSRGGGGHHHTHCLLQIRRYVYHDVIRLQDMQRLLDCSQVQTYIINSSRVVFLNQRPQPRPSKGLGNACATCDRSLQDSYSYCSVACKADAAIRQAAGHRRRLNLVITNSSKSLLPSLKKAAAAKLLDVKEEEEADSPASDDMRISPTQTSSTRTGSDEGVGGGLCGTAITSTAASTMMPKKLRSGRLSVLVTSPKSVLQLVPVSSSVKRRKGIPHRSPVC